MLHHGIKCAPMAYGFKDFNGNIWCNDWVDTYNNYSAHILSVTGNSKMCRAERDAIADRRYQFFVQCMSICANS